MPINNASETQCIIKIQKLQHHSAADKKLVSVDKNVATWLVSRNISDDSVNDNDCINW